MKILDRLRQKVLFREVEKAARGYLMCRRVRRKYGEDTHIIIVRGKTGDIYLYFRFLEAYLKKNNIQKYAMVGDCKNLKAIKQLYPNINGIYIQTSEYMGLCLQSAYCLWGREKLNVSLSLMWDVDLPVNRCAVRLTDRFNFIDSYYWFLFDLDRENTAPVQAQFEKLTEPMKKQLQKEGYKKGKTVIISPYAYCVKCLPSRFWNLLGKDLEKRGYKVLFMLDPVHERNDFGFPSVFFKYKDSVAVLEYAGHFIGLRSGFCDIISSAKCNKVILYPEKPKEFDGSVHRADIEYSSLYNMELATDAAEIVVPFARDISNLEPEEEDLMLHFQADRKLNQEILSNFPPLGKGRRM